MNIESERTENSLDPWWAYHGTNHHPIKCTYCK